nr:hypothetical protein [Jeotgalibacillus malaysiensis]
MTKPKKQTAVIEYDFLKTLNFEELPEWKRTLIILYLLHKTQRRKAFTANKMSEFYTDYHLKLPDNIHFCLYHACERKMMEHHGYNPSGEKTYSLTNKGIDFAAHFIKEEITSEKKNSAIDNELYDFCKEFKQQLVHNEISWMSIQKTIKEQLIAAMFLIKIKMRKDELSSSELQVILAEVFDIQLPEKSIQSAVSRMKPDIKRVRTKKPLRYSITRTGVHSMRKSIELHQE